MNLRAIALLCLALSTLTACGTIARGTSDDVTIEVEPADALVRTSYGRVCRGPCKIRAPRAEDFTVTAEKPGYASQTVEVRSRVCLLYTSPSPRDKRQSRMPSSA